MPKLKGSPFKFIKDPEIAKSVEAYAGIGVRQEDISRLVKIPLNTLKKHFPDELGLGAVKATSKIAGALYRSALEGNTTAQIFWLKTRGGWRETDRLEVSVENRASVVVLPYIYESVEDWIEAGKPKIKELTGNDE